MRGKLLRSALLAASLFGMIAGANAAISVTAATGAGPFDFSAAPVGGDWDTISVAGGAGDITTDAALQASAMTNDASNIVGALAPDNMDPIPNGGLARWMSTTMAIGTRPTNVRYTLLKATLFNSEPDVITSLKVSYTLKTNTAATCWITEHIYGHQVYYSVSGAPGSWTRITAFNVGNFADPQNLSATLSVFWPPATSMYLLWVDDNGPRSNDAAPTDREGGYLLDDFVISDVVTTPILPPAITQQPASVSINERQVARLHVAANGINLTYQWYHSNTMTMAVTPIPGATTDTYFVTNRLGGSRYPWSNPTDNGTYYVVVNSTVPPAVTSVPATVTVAPDVTKPTFLYAICGPSPDQFTLTLSEPLRVQQANVTDPFNWQLKPVGDEDDLHFLSVIDVAYTDDGMDTTIVFTFTNLPPRDVTKAYEIRPTEAFNDTAQTPNALASLAAVEVFCFSNEILPLSAVWRYNDTGADLGPSWYTGPDSLLPSSGPGIFDCKRDNNLPDALPYCRPFVQTTIPVGTCTQLSNIVTLTFITNHYFRTHFNYSGDLSKTFLVLDTHVDDGGIIYLNGTELQRIRMPAGALNNTSFATGGSTPADAPLESYVYTPGSPLVLGDNVIAAQVAQSGANSSDLTWGCRVAVLVSTPPLKLSISYDGAGNVTVRWGGGTGPGTLRSSTSITAPRPWPEVTGASSPYTTTATGSQRFYEVSNP